MCSLGIAVCSNHMYVAAAVINYDITNNVKAPSCNAWQLPVSVLEEVLTKSKKTFPQCQWKEIASTPNTHTTLVKNSNHPVTIGGALRGDLSGCNSTCNISMYDPVCDKWFIVGHLMEPRARCTVVCVSECSILVYGGYRDTVKDPQPCISSVEMLNINSVSKESLRTNETDLAGKLPGREWLAN